ncbi:hypothetical protein [Leifsonia sp. LS-T14]|uniref:hypothetical protein n=1 Tax=unclassified Leifsonia TaxID=2663824 RepID=UPI0035A6E942
MVAEEQDTSDRGGFDPRFDPSFQRGYQPKPGERQQTRVRGDAPDSAYRRPGSVLQRPVEPPVESPVPSQLDADRAPISVEYDTDPMPASLAGAESAYVVAGPGLLAHVDVNPRRNPLILTLWIIGAGFVVLGIVLYCISVTSSYSGPTPSSDVGSLVFAQLGWMLAGPLITVGLLTLVGLLFLTALAGRSAREVVPADEEL